MAIVSNRASNIELLRIVAMLMIVGHHMLIHGVSQVVGSNNVVLLLCDNLLIYGVNIFLLISGYFLIKFTWKKLFSLLWICCFYKIFHLCFRQFILDDPQSLIAWVGKPLGVLFSTGGWFMDIYILVFLLSPIINKALLSMSHREYKVGLIIILAVNIFWGWIKADAINPNGYTIAHFIMMYYIGYGCKMLISSRWLKELMWGGGICVAMLSILVLLLHNGIYCSRLYAYNNPMIILGSVAIFTFFATMKPFRSSAVNFIAASVFPVYLIHEQSGFKEWFMEIVAQSYSSNCIVFFASIFVLIVISLFTFTLIIDQIRKWLSPYVVNICMTIERIIVQPIIDRL